MDIKEQRRKKLSCLLSDDDTHGSVSVQLTRNKMINNADIDEGSALAIENDNCSSQYKWPGHFRVLQMKKIFQSLEFRESNVAGLSKVNIRKKKL